MCCFPAKQKVKYLAVKQCVGGVITRETPYVIILFWRPLFLAFLFQLLIIFVKLKGSLNIRVLQ